MIPGLVQTNAVEIGSNAEPRPDFARGNQPLARALTRIFNHPDDRVFWELSPGEQGVVLGRSCIAAAGGNLRPVAAGYGLATALGASYAQQRLVQDNWVVATLDGPLLIESLNPRATEQLRNSHRRLILVLCEPDDRNLRLSHDELRERLERLGTPVLGPVDESDEELLAEHLRFARRLQRPAIVRVRTHDAGLRALDDSNGTQQSGPLQRASRVLQEVLDSELLDLGKSHAHLMLLSFGDRFEFPNFAADCSGRYFEAPAAEADALVWCRGLAAGGCTPFVITDGEGLNRGWDCITREWEGDPLPLCLVVTEGELSSAGARRSVLARLRQLPNATVLSPANRGELREMLRIGAEAAGITAIHVSPDTPWLHPLEFSENTVEVGRGALLIEGCDVALIAVGSAVATAVRAADELSSLGCSTAVLNVRSVSPLDAGLIASTARGVDRVVVVEERSSRGGLGSAVLELLSDEDVCRPVTLFATSSSPHLSSGKIAGELVERVLSLRSRRESENSGGQPSGAITFSREELDRELQLIRRVEFGSDLTRWVHEYSRVGRRSEYLWRWCLHGSRLTTLPSVDVEWREHVCETKVLSIILCVMLDDVADQPGRADFLDLLAHVVERDDFPVSDRWSRSEREYAEVARALAREYHDRVRSYPCFAPYEELLQYDHQQHLNTMRYSSLVNRRLDLLNPTEGDMYAPHGMHMMSFATLDLMCSPQFPCHELGKLREAVWHFQCMGRIGNLLSTWRREVAERDFTGGVFALALAQGDITLDQLQRARPEELEAAISTGQQEQFYLRRWNFHWENGRRKALSIRSLELRELLEGNRRFLLAHLGSRGLI